MTSRILILKPLQAFEYKIRHTTIQTTHLLGTPVENPIFKAEAVRR
jgi:hypothetical protein